MLKAYKQFWMRYANFTGRSSRSEYWWAVLCNVLIGLPFGAILFVSLIPVISMAINQPNANAAFTLSIVALPLVLIVLLGLFYLATLVPNLAITVRRLRDAGYHWAFIFLLAPHYLAAVVPLLSLLVLPCDIALIVLLAMPTKAGLSETAPAGALAGTSEAGLATLTTSDVLEKTEVSADESSDDSATPSTATQSVDAPIDQEAVTGLADDLEATAIQNDTKED